MCPKLNNTFSLQSPNRLEYFVVSFFFCCSLYCTSFSDVIAKLSKLCYVVISYNMLLYIYYFISITIVGWDNINIYIYI